MSNEKNRASTRVSKKAPADEIEQAMATARDFMRRMAPEEVQREAIYPASAVVCHIMLLNSVLERCANRFAEEHGLTLTQWMALGCIGNGGEIGLRHTELGERLMLSKAPVTGVVDRLERAGYVQRRADAEDRRASRITITPRGLEAWKNVRGALRENAKKMCSDLSGDEQKQLLRMLARFLESAAEGDPILAACRNREK